MAWNGVTYQPAPTLVPDDLVIKHWAKQVWDSGINESYWGKFIGSDSNAIIHAKEELSKNSGDTIIIPLRMPLVGAGIIDDDMLEGNEEALTFRDFKVELHYVRHATRLKGRYEEQKTQIDLRKESSNAIKDWNSRYFDLSVFSVATGTPFPLLNNPTDTFPFPIEPPSPDRVLYAAGKTSEGALALGDNFDTKIISQAKRKAIENEVRAIRPIRIDGGEHYVMLIDHWQARDLRSDPKWLEAQQSANVRGRKNPIFDGSIGMWDGVVVHECGRVPRTATGAGGTMVGHALLLGAQAITFAKGANPYLVKKKFDYDHQWAISIGRSYGLKRSMFKYDGVNYTDYGLINVMTASTED